MRPQTCTLRAKQPHGRACRGAKAALSGGAWSGSTPGSARTPHVAHRQLPWLPLCCRCDPTQLTAPGAERPEPPEQRPGGSAAVFPSSCWGGTRTSPRCLSTVTARARAAQSTKADVRGSAKHLQQANHPWSQPMKGVATFYF